MMESSFYVYYDIIYTSSHIHYNRSAIEHYSIAQEFQFYTYMRNISSPKHATVILFQLPFESLTITGKVDISILRNFLVVIKLSVHFD